MKPETSIAPDTKSWQFPGWGTIRTIDDLGAPPTEIKHLDSGFKHKLGEWKATAICGNDITSSCLYVAALCALYAGVLAPVALLLVAAVLFLFRKIYAEVGTALPLNGGAYNALLNTTSKGKASIAACLTILSYVATAVISASEAMHYAHNLFSAINVFWATIILLGIFAALNILGLTESAIVALVIFIFHITTLTILVVASGLTVIQNPAIFLENLQIPTGANFAVALFFGFSAGLLGISGFESSANFIEEQKPGVFPKTLRNMWIAVAVFNPLISLLSLGLLSLVSIANNKESLLAEMGFRSFGKPLEILVSVDAVLVLSGAVLTSYVGITGLVRRMSLDRCLPQFFLRENDWRCTNHWIILGFFGLCCSVLIITAGNIVTLAGVYTLSFLGVMMLFAFGNILLKMRRERLPRDVRASWIAVIVALVAVVAGIVGNVLLNPDYVKIFGIYFAITLAAVGVMFFRVSILKVFLTASRSLVDFLRSGNRFVSEKILGQINRINSQKMIFFSKGDSIATLNQAALYVLENEQTNSLQVIHCYAREEDIPPQLAEQLKTLDEIYPKLRIDLIFVKGKFGPELIEQLSRKLEVPKNYMFIGTPGDRFPHNIAELGGVRLII